MTKILLVLIVLAIAFDLVNGVNLFKNNYYWRSQYFGLQKDYWETELAFINYNYGSFYNWLKNGKEKKAISQANPEKADSIPILLYHGVIEDPNWQPDDVSVRLVDFREQMFALKKAGYETIRMQDYLDFIRRKKDLPAKSFLLTFDDGRKDSYYTVDPILRTLGYTAIMNVITGRSLGAGNEKGAFHLSRLELQKMIESGRWEMESHGRNDHDYIKIDATGQEGHFLSDKLWLAQEKRLETREEFSQRITNDLANSKKDLENQLGIKVLAFAYPFGDFGQASTNFLGNEDLITAAAKAVYPLSFTQTGSSDFLANYPENSFLAKRMNINSKINARQLVKIMEEARDKSLPYEDSFATNNGWLKGWGTVEINGAGLTISDSANEDSGLAFLSGTYLWSDYLAEAALTMPKGNSFALLSRYVDENNYVACDFSNIHAALTQKVAGKDGLEVENLQGVDFGGGKIINVGMALTGNQASCLIDGQPVVHGLVDGRFNHGGISFKIWDQTLGQKGTTLVVKKLRVEKLPLAPGA